MASTAFPLRPDTTLSGGGRPPGRFPRRARLR